MNVPPLKHRASDPILGNICDAWNYKAKLEESIKSQQTESSPKSQTESGPRSQTESGPDSSDLESESQVSSSSLLSTPKQKVQPEPYTPRDARFHGMITERSKSDYTVYSVTLDDHNDASSIVSLVIETKHTQNSLIEHVICQVIGYYTAYNVSVNSCLAIVITEEYIQLIFFSILSYKRR